MSPCPVTACRRIIITCAPADATGRLLPPCAAIHAVPLQQLYSTCQRALSSIDLASACSGSGLLTPRYWSTISVLPNGTTNAAVAFRVADTQVRWGRPRTAHGAGHRESWYMADVTCVAHLRNRPVCTVFCMRASRRALCPTA